MNKVEFFIINIHFFLFLFYFSEDKRDFVEQLNELSTKQHRRQYSGYLFIYLLIKK